MNLKRFYQQANNTSSNYPKGQALHAVIGNVCTKNTEKTAVFCEDQQLTYGELDVAANQLANFLIEKGVRKGDLVGVCCDRNIDMPVLLNGILRAGAGYVPLDPDYPVERLQYMVENAELKHVVAHQSQRSLVELFDSNSVFYDAEHSQISKSSATMPPIEIDARKDIAYVIFTSGSTGKPKGVLIPHQAAVNLMFAFGQQPGFNTHDRLLATTTLSFDISVVEMFLPLAMAGQLVIVDRETAKDQTRLIDAIKKFEITFMQATPSMWRIVCEGDFDGGAQMKFVVGGEPLPRDLIDPMLKRCGELWNCYGPTEATVWSSVKRIESSSERILVGTPLSNTTAYVVDENRQLCPPETEGELWIGGDCVSLGYLKRNELTAEKFVELDGERVYRSGDLCKITENGEVEILGRIDSQIKLRGHRIELGEIDAAIAMSDENVRLAAAVLREDSPGDQRLVGYVLPHEGKNIDIQNLRLELQKSLPEYMVPAVITAVDEFPYTPSGKTDRKSFPPPSTKRPDLGVEFVAPRTKQENALAEIWRDVLQLDRIGAHDNFFELGGNSIKALKVVKYSNEAIDSNVTNAEFFDAPTIKQFVASASNAKKVPRLQNKSSATSRQQNQFAVVGMAAKMPGAKDVKQFWKNLVEGKETIRFFDESELDSTLPETLTQDLNYVKARGIVDDADLIDSKFFNMPPREAQLVDPQQRLMLELSWTALEDAGCIPSKFAGTIGVWAGCYESSYFQKNILTNPEIVQETGEFQLGVYNEKDYIATRVAHRLDLTGPAINVNTACSTSLVAIIEACKSLKEGHCDAAIAGGVSIHFPQNSGHLHQDGSIFSPDGHCRPFDADSAGTLFSDGAGVVILKRLEDAIADNDRVYATINGFGINNDGGKKASFSAPSIEGQSKAIAMAHASAELDVDSIGYVEAHGTATPIGDPIEVAALTRAFATSTNQKQFCYIGSVKGNIGHTVAAAGVAGFIKAALSLFHEKIPPTLHYQKPNPQIDFESTPFSVASALKSWQRKESPRFAGVSSFGVGGTNAHVILSESPVVIENTEESCQLLTVSARTESAREVAINELAEYLNGTDESLASIATTLNVGRESFKHKAFCVATSLADSSDKLAAKRAPKLIQRSSLSGSRNVVFMFPGQGAQYVRMGQNLCQRSPVFRDSLNRCCEILEPLLGRDLKGVLFPSSEKLVDSDEILKATRFTQPALFSIGYSLGTSMISLGVQPTAMIGHSIGEFAAACLAGVFNLEDGLRLIAKRGDLMQELPEGKMMSVRLPGKTVEPLISGQMAIASYNGPELCVVAGPEDQVLALQNKLEADGAICKFLHTSHAFHSPMMDSIVDPYSRFVGDVDLHAPEIPILSTVTGNWMRDEEATDPAYWAEHLRQPVRFSDAVTALWTEDPDLVLVELGPRRTLSTLAMQHAKDRKTQIAIPTMADSSDQDAEWMAYLHAVGNLWSLGVETDLSQLSSGRKTSLPTYPFERKRFFIEPGSGAIEPLATDTANRFQTHNQDQEIEPSKPGESDMNRLPKIIENIFEVFENSSGFDLNEFDNETTFFEMGLDSLVLTQTASALKRNFEVEVTFRQLLEETPNVVSLAEYLDRELPADKFAVEPATCVDSEKPQINEPVEPTVPTNIQRPMEPSPVPQVSTQAQPVPVFQVPQVQQSSGTIAESVINNQLQIMAAQLQLLGGNGAPVVQQVASHVETSQPSVAKCQDHWSTPTPNTETKAPKTTGSKSKDELPAKKAFGAAARVNLNADNLNDVQQAKLDEIIRQSERMMPSSKEYAQKHRQYMADPRTVSGFQPNLKEMTFPIVIERSKGVNLFDLDGNTFIDYTCGFGSNFLGHGTDMIVKAVSEQLPKDYSIGPQSPLAGEVAQMFCELTGNERMAYSNTGSEAVLGCTRLARTFTGKQKIAMFTGDYHGILDEVIVRGNKTLKSFPAATGIPREHVDNTLILDYGSSEALQLIRENLDDLAAVVVETVQSRRPEWQPKEFLHELRAMTEDVDTALIFDEVITGFRIAPGGAQQHFGIRADLASYGKIVGGGMPIGLIGGRAKYMDGLDGGFWQYGDDSRPEAGMTYFAGTFVRHPLTLAASKAILGFIKSGGQAMYDRLNSLSDNMAQQLNEMFRELDAPLYLANFGSMFKVQFEQELPYSELIFAKLRLKGFFIWDHRPCLLNVQHTQAHVDAFVEAFREVIVELQQAGFVPGEGYKKFVEFNPNKPPCPEAKVGKDKQGNPGWFVADAANPGQFVQLNQTM